MGKGGHIQFFGEEAQFHEAVLDNEDEAHRIISEMDRIQLEAAFARAGLNENNNNTQEVVSDGDDESSVDSAMSLPMEQWTLDQLADEVERLNNIIANEQLSFQQRELILRDIRNIRFMIAERFETDDETDDEGPYVIVN